MVIGQVTSSRVRSDFNNELAAAVDNLSDRVRPRLQLQHGPAAGAASPSCEDYAAPGNADHPDPAQTDGTPLDQTKGAPNFGLIYPQRSARIGGLRVEVRQRPVRSVNAETGRPSRLLFSVVLQYGRKVSDIEATIRRIRLFLSAGVLGGTLLALLGGVLLGRRAMLPVAAA